MPAVSRKDGANQRALNTVAGDEAHESLEPPSFNL